MSIFRKLFKQSKPKLWVGGARDMMQRVQSYYGQINALMALATLYTVREATIQKYAPWASFLVVVGIGFVIMVVLVIVDYKLVYPSQIAFHQHEAYKHRNLIRRDLEEYMARQVKADEQIKIINDKLDSLIGQEGPHDK